MPRENRTKPPRPFLPVERFQRSAFQISEDQWKSLTRLLPPQLTQQPSRLPKAPSDNATKVPATITTIADDVIFKTEQAIMSHLSGDPIISEGRINPANVRAAIRRLRNAISRVREALEPFDKGWVDSETAEIISTDLDGKLE